MNKVSRNKYPEETENLILEVSLKLFLEKGYDHTTIQDIINNLGGLTKGAVYHHFSSKEEILQAVTERMFKDNSLSKKWEITKKNKDLSGSEKLVTMMMQAIEDPQEQKFRTLGINLQNTPHMLCDLFMRSVSEIAPKTFQPVVEEGVLDGSIKTNHPKELAQLIAVLANIWINPIVFKMSDEELKAKFQLIAELTKPLGIDIDKVYDSLEEMNRSVNK